MIVDPILWDTLYIRNNGGLRCEAACRLNVWHAAPRPPEAHMLQPKPRTSRGGAPLHALGAEHRQPQDPLFIHW